MCWDTDLTKILLFSNIHENALRAKRTIDLVDKNKALSVDTILCDSEHRHPYQPVDLLMRLLPNWYSHVFIECYTSAIELSTITEKIYADHRVDGEIHRLEKVTTARVQAILHEHNRLAEFLPNMDATERTEFDYAYSQRQRLATLRAQHQYIGRTANALEQSFPCYTADSGRTL